MSLLVRLIHILRAGLRAGLAPEEGRWRRQSSEPGSRTFQGGGRRERSAEPRSDVDPVLAGYYANLEVPYGSDLETVHRGWKRLLRKYHPDLHSTDPQKRRIATELTQGLNRAYEELEKRLGGGGNQK